MSTEGTLYTYTTQEFPPPLPYKGNRDPKVFQPYVVGFVELPEGVLVETLIVGATADQLTIGQRLVSTTTTLETEDGRSLVTFAFRPAGELGSDRVTDLGSPPFGLHPLHGVHEPTTGNPPRRPRSARRTTSIDMTRDDGSLDPVYLNGLRVICGPRPTEQRPSSAPRHSRPPSS